MSAQVVDSVHINLARSFKEQARARERAEDNPTVIRRLHFETVYQICFAPEPTPEQIAHEIFLLECD